MSFDASSWIDKIRSCKNRNQCAVLYAQAITALPLSVEVFGPINRAILDRWSRAGLCCIKEKAWKIAQAKEAT